MSQENVDIVRRYLEKGFETVSPEMLPSWVVRAEDHVTAKGALRALGLSGETLEAAGLSR